MSSLPNLTRWPCSCSSSRKIGSTARQGPHHGAQKSTTTGPSASSTSCAKFASVSSCIGSMLQLAQQGPEAERRYLPDRLEHDRPAHLRMTFLAVDEPDRHLGDAEALAERPVGRLDLEGVALGVDRLEVDRLEHGAAIALEAAGQVVHSHTEQEPRVKRAPGRDDAAAKAPVLDGAAADV